MAVQIQLRRGTAAQWTSANPTLASGEVGYETDTNKEKIGDGTTAWNSLAYFGGGSPGGSTTQVQFNSSGSFAGDANLTFSGSTLTSANLIVSNLTVSQAVFSSATKQLVSNPITGTGSVVMNASPIITSPSLITPALGSPTSGNMSATTNIPVANATGTLAVANGGTGVTASTGSGSVVLNTSPTLTTPTLISPVLGTPTSGNLVATTNIPVANATGTLAVANGGTGLTSTPANGALDIGNGTNFTRTTLTAGTNVTITNGAGSITIAASGGSGSPGGSSGQIQYNNSGAFGGFANLTYNLTGPIVNTTIGVGNATPSTSGFGITFPSGESLSTNANTLDDYEEGTFSPTIDSATPGTGRATTVTTATYTKIGRSVSVVMYLTLATLGTGGSGQIVINGLPFTGASYTGLSVGYAVNTAANLVAIGAYLTTGSTSINITGNAAASTVPLGNLAFATYAAATFGIMVCGTYFI